MSVNRASIAVGAVQEGGAGWGEVGGGAYLFWFLNERALALDGALPREQLRIISVLITLISVLARTSVRACVRLAYSRGLIT